MLPEGPGFENTRRVGRSPSHGWRGRGKQYHDDSNSLSGCYLRPSRPSSATCRKVLVQDKLSSAPEKSRHYGPSAFVRGVVSESGQRRGTHIKPVFNSSSGGRRAAAIDRFGRGLPSLLLQEGFPTGLDGPFAVQRRPIWFQIAT